MSTDIEIYCNRVERLHLHVSVADRRGASAHCEWCRRRTPCAANVAAEPERSMISASSSEIVEGRFPEGEGSAGGIAVIACRY